MLMVTQPGSVTASVLMTVLTVYGSSGETVRIVEKSRKRFPVCGSVRIGSRQPDAFRCAAAFSTFPRY